MAFYSDFHAKFGLEMKRKYCNALVRAVAQSGSIDEKNGGRKIHSSPYRIQYYSFLARSSLLFYVLKPRSLPLSFSLTLLIYNYYFHFGPFSGLNQFKNHKILKIPCKMQTGTVLHPCVENPQQLRQKNLPKI